MCRRMECYWHTQTFIFEVKKKPDFLLPFLKQQVSFIKFFQPQYDYLRHVDGWVYFYKGEGDSLLPFVYFSIQFYTT